MMYETYIEKIPTYAMCAIINDDWTGLEEEDEKNIREWLEKCGYDIIGCPSNEDEPYFTTHPAFGLPCDVYDVECLIKIG